MCPTTGVSFNEPAPHSFSFNSPHGACPRCNGLGFEAVYDVERIIPDSEKSIAQGGILPLGKNQTPYLKAQLEALAARYDFSLTDPVKSISEEAMKAIVYGDSEPLRVENKISGLSNNYYMVRWEGIEEFIERQFEDVTVNKGAKWKEQFIRHEPCSLCGGSRLNQETQYFKVAGKSIAEVSDMSIDELSVWFSDIESKMSQKHQTIAHDILKEIRERLRFLVEVGLGYLSLSRASASLSGGEGQRIRLATEIGSKLVNVL
jgi:excinuclease ABC subunit A